MPNISLKGPLLVVAAVIENSKNEVLIALRPHSHKVEGGKWEFPGGKVEAGETPESALVREIREELGIEIRVESWLGLTSHVYQDAGVHVVLLFYRCTHLAGEFNLCDVAEVRWVSRNVRPDLEFAAAEADILGQVFV